jgi:hypothetical protein
MSLLFSATTLNSILCQVVEITLPWSEIIVAHS